MGAKKFLPMRVQETAPTGDITDARQPIPVAVRLRWNMDARYIVIENAWAMAWTRTEVLVYFREGGEHPTTVWLAAYQVKRRAQRPRR